jgi:ubiquinone/menaquinone biosynthesis C-methylase UbiE
VFHVKQPHRVCDYEGSPYRRVFWEDADRAYEDAAEHLAVRALLPRTGGRLLDIGAGFGRLVDAYSGHADVFLLDYARSMLQDARSRNGDRCTYVCADLYRLPFATASIDTVVQVRVLHHVERIEDAFAEVARVLRPGGAYVLEFANKRNLKSLVRHGLGRQAEDPFDERPYEFVAMNWDFHPAHIAHALREAGLFAAQQRAVSQFRVPWLKRRVSPALLARVDGLLGARLAPLALAPSHFVRSIRHGGPDRVDGLWRCPACAHEPLMPTDACVPCPACGRLWPITDGLHLLRDGA